MEVVKSTIVTLECGDIIAEIHPDGHVLWGENCAAYSADELLMVLETICDELRKVSDWKENRDGHYTRWSDGGWEEVEDDRLDT